jgi:hypothetical protein
VSCNKLRDILLSGINTTSGHDRLDAKLAKEMVDFIITPLDHIFNLSFAKGIVSYELKMGKSFPIHKDFFFSLPILPSTSTILEKLANNRLIKYQTSVWLQKNLTLLI